jgi:hypothetical protein
MLSCSPCHIFCSVVIIIHTYVILFTVLLLVNGTVLSLWLTECSWINSARYRKFCCSCPPTKKTPIFLTHVLITVFATFLLGRGMAGTVTGLLPLRPKVTPTPVIVGCGEQLCTVTVLSPSSLVSLVIVIPAMLHTHSSICHWCDIILGIDTVVWITKFEE